MAATSILPLMTMLLLFPAPRDPEPDDKGRGFFGVQLVDDGGVTVTRVEPGSPADKAGIRGNDIIQSVDAARVPSVNEAREAIGRLRPGTITVVEIRRGAATVTVKVKVGVRPETLP